MKKIIISSNYCFFGENFYINILFILTFSNSEPHIEGLKLFKINNKLFVETYLEEP